MVHMQKGGYHCPRWTQIYMNCKIHQLTFLIEYSTCKIFAAVRASVEESSAGPNSLTHTHARTLARSLILPPMIIPLTQ